MMPDGFYALATSAELRSTRPLQRNLGDTPLALFRHRTGVSAVLDRCPHRNVPLSGGRVRSGCLECPYHGWRFGPQGRLLAIPGWSGAVPEVAVETFRVREAADLIFVARGSGGGEPYRCALAEDPDYHAFPLVYRCRGTLLNALENLLDATHTHTVHSGLIRSDRAPRRQVLARIRPSREAVEIEYLEEGGQSGLISRLFEGERTTSFGRFRLPSVAELEYRDRRGIRFLLVAYFTPQGPSRQLVIAQVYTRRGRLPLALKKWVLGPLLNLAARQDGAVLARQADSLERFGGEDFRSGPLDLMRPYLQVLLSRGELSVEREREVWLAL